MSERRTNEVGEKPFSDATRFYRQLPEENLTTCKKRTAPKKGHNNIILSLFVSKYIWEYIFSKAAMFWYLISDFSKRAFKTIMVLKRAFHDSKRKC